MELRRINLLVLPILLIISMTLSAQQDPQFSQNMHNKLFVNPAFAGMNDGICASVLSRQQWVGFEGRPETYVFGAHGTFTLPVINWRSGGGLTIMTDGVAQSRFFGLKGQYSLHIPMNFIGGNPGHLGVGVSAGYQQFSLGNNWRATDSYYYDELIPDEGFQSGGFDMDAGLYYQTQLAQDRKLYVGLSMMHVNGVEFSGEGNAISSQFPNDNRIKAWSTDYKMYRHYYLMSGFDYPVPGYELFVLKPSVFVKTDGVSAQFDVNMNVEWNNFVWAGASYRSIDAVSVMAGVNTEVPGLPGTIRAGYSYDITTSRLIQGSAGSHEVFVQYCFKLKPQPPVPTHKSVRFL